MQQYIILFRSITHAQRAARTLERAGLSGSVVRAPMELTGNGCGYGLRVPERTLERSRSLLAAAGLKTGKVFSLSPGHEEVAP